MNNIAGGPAGNELDAVISINHISGGVVEYGTIPPYHIHGTRSNAGQRGPYAHVNGKFTLVCELLPDGRDPSSLLGTWRLGYHPKTRSTTISSVQAF